MTNKKQPQPAALDLFGQTPVLESDLLEYIDRFVPTLSSAEWRIRNYIKHWNVADKVRRLKISGDWYV